MLLLSSFAFALRSTHRAPHNHATSRVSYELAAATMSVPFKDHAFNMSFSEDTVSQSVVDDCRQRIESMIGVDTTLHVREGFEVLGTPIEGSVLYFEEASTVHPPLLPSILDRLKALQMSNYLDSLAMGLRDVLKVKIGSGGVESVSTIFDFDFTLSNGVSIESWKDFQQRRRKYIRDGDADVVKASKLNVLIDLLDKLSVEERQCFSGKHLNNEPCELYLEVARQVYSEYTRQTGDVNLDEKTERDLKYFFSL